MDGGSTLFVFCCSVCEHGCKFVIVAIAMLVRTLRGIGRYRTSLGGVIALRTISACLTTLPKSELTLKAKAGDVEAQYALAMRLLQSPGDIGNGNSAEEIVDGIRTTITRNRKKSCNHSPKEHAIQWLEASASNGHLRALLTLAELKQKEDHFDEAIVLYERALTFPAFPPEIYCILGTLHYELGSEEDLSKSFDYFMKGADAGVSNAMYQVAMCYLYGAGTSIDIERAQHYMNIAAQNQDSDALYFLAMAYLNGHDELPIAKDTLKFLEYIRLAHDVGSAEATFCLADMYLHGEYGLSENLEYAVRYYKEAVERGHGDAALCLGALYYRGRGYLERDLEKAFELYNVAAERGCVAAWPNLASMYAKGEGVEKSEHMSNHILKYLDSIGYGKQ